MALEEDVIVIAERDGPLDGLVGREGLRVLVAGEIPPAANLHSDGELIAVERFRVLAGLGAFFGIPGIFLSVLGEDVDEFDDEIAVGSRSGSKKRCGERSGYNEIMIERRAHKGQ